MIPRSRPESEPKGGPLTECKMKEIDIKRETEIQNRGRDSDRDLDFVMRRATRYRNSFYVDASGATGLS
ncbi:hypothetical protein EVAR_95920_1 [Eumeta japonica]|uniref:Uncharacterized protein n=1 Tax=Eumeta variegata TaxID=151549 RepID=A0A4C1XL68_EUMVA|nr:hypothetical protein EVAR_95920_1 [Eumeta japonica]